ncbi:hypothetical protein HK098_002995 [Nowakowskiella sp. JEL0407]|nr:hypothetical protein HK098_002995 [Nowakowskiella sp. JEL0407]
MDSLAHSRELSNLQSSLTAQISALQLQNDSLKASAEALKSHFDEQKASCEAKLTAANLRIIDAEKRAALAELNWAKSGKIDVENDRKIRKIEMKAKIELLQSENTQFKLLLASQKQQMMDSKIEYESEIKRYKKSVCELRERLNLLNRESSAMLTTDAELPDDVDVKGKRKIDFDQELKSIDTEANLDLLKDDSDFRKFSNAASHGLKRIQVDTPPRVESPEKITVTPYKAPKLPGSKSSSKSSRSHNSSSSKRHLSSSTVKWVQEQKLKAADSLPTPKSDLKKKDQSGIPLDDIQLPSSPSSTSSVLSKLKSKKPSGSHTKYTVPKPTERIIQTPEFLRTVVAQVREEAVMEASGQVDETDPALKDKMELGEGVNAATTISISKDVGNNPESMTQLPQVNMDEYSLMNRKPEDVGGSIIDSTLIEYVGLFQSVPSNLTRNETNYSVATEQDHPEPQPTVSNHRQQTPKDEKENSGSDYEGATVELDTHQSKKNSGNSDREGDDNKLEEADLVTTTNFLGSSPYSSPDFLARRYPSQSLNTNVENGLSNSISRVRGGSPTPKPTSQATNNGGVTTMKNANIISTTTLDNVSSPKFKAPGTSKISTTPATKIGGSVLKRNDKSNARDTELIEISSSPEMELPKRVMRAHSTASMPQQQQQQTSFRDRLLEQSDGRLKRGVTLANVSEGAQKKRGGGSKSEPKYKYAETVRGNERKKLTAVDCPECGGFYEAVGIPPATELNGTKSTTTAGWLQQVGRHRSKYQELSTPPGYWDPDFPSTQEVKNNNEERKRMIENHTENHYEGNSHHHNFHVIEAVLRRIKSITTSIPVTVRTSDNIALPTSRVDSADLLPSSTSFTVITEFISLAVIFLDEYVHESVSLDIEPRNESKAVSRIGSRVGLRIGSQVNSRVGTSVGSRKTSRSGSPAGSAKKRSANVNASSVTDVVESPTKDADIEPIKVIPEPPKVEQQALQEPKSFIKRVLMLKQKMEQEKKAQEEEQQRRLQLETQKLTAESMEIGGPISQTDESDVPKITIGLPTFTVQSASNEDLSSEQKDTNKNIPVFNIEIVPDEDPTNDSNPTINIDIIEEADDTEEADSSAINANTETVSSPPISKLDKIGQSSTSLLSIFPSSPTRNSTTRSRKRSALGSGFLLSASNSGLPGRRHRPSAHKIDRTAAANLIFGNGEKKRRRRPLFFRHGFGTRSSSLAGIHEKVKNVDAVLSTERKEKIKEAEKIVELFGEYGVPVSQKVIEKGLLSPEDFLRAKQKEDEDETVGLCNIEDSKHPNMLISSDWVDLLYNTNPKDDTEKKKKKNIEIDFDFYSEQRVRYPHTMAHVNARPKSLSRINADDIRILNTDTDEKMNRTRTYWSTEEYRKMKRDFEEKLRLQEEERKILKMSYYLKSRRMMLMRKRMESEAVDEYSSSKVLVDYTHSTKYSSKLRDTTNFAVDPGRARVDHKTGELLLPLSDSQTKNQQINQPPTKYHPLNSLSTTPLPEISSHQRKRSQTSSLFDNKADRKVLHVPWRRATSAFYTKGGNGSERVISRPRTTVGETMFHEKFADHRRSVSESRDKGTVYVQGSYERYKPGILI